MAAQNPDILTIAEVAEFLKVAERTIYRLAAAKKIPAFKVGGAWRFARADIERWISQQTAGLKDGDPPDFKESDKEHE
jgi:excisionase family DNA binding protein